MRTPNDQPGEAKRARRAPVLPERMETLPLPIECPIASSSQPSPSKSPTKRRSFSEPSPASYSHHSRSTLASLPETSCMQKCFSFAGDVQVVRGES